MSLETVILNNIVNNEVYTRKVLPFLKEEYFQDTNQRFLFETIASYINEYNTLPSKSAITLTAENAPLNEEALIDVQQTIEVIYRQPDVDSDKLAWLVDQTETFCQDKALYNAINDAILAYNNQHQSLNKDGIPQLLTDALSVTFDTHIGHDFIDDADDRFASYQKSTVHVPCGVDTLDKIMDGGFPCKSLTVVMAGTGAGKSLFMGSCAAHQLMEQKNVLYISLELSEEMVGKRIDANLLNVPINELSQMPIEDVERKVQRLKSTTKGKLIIKEYPPASVGAITIKALLQELRIKKAFVPDIIYVDYLNLCVSQKFKNGSVGPYQYYKAVAEELRAIAVEHDIPVVTATQLNRSGYTNSDADLEDTAESFGVPQTADIMFVFVTNEELRDQGQVMGKQLKNRFGDINNPKRFIVGVDYEKMRMYDVDFSGPDKVIMDATEVGAFSNPTQPIPGAAERKRFKMEEFK